MMLIIALTIVLAGCSLFSLPKATLTIENRSSYELINVTVNGISFGSIPSGRSVSRDSPKSGYSISGYIYFNLAINSIALFTNQQVAVSEDSSGTFTFTDTTMVRSSNAVPANTLASFATED